MTGRRRLVTATLAVALLLPACAGLPTSGDVQRASDVSGEGDLVTYQPAPPAPGAEPEEVVAGFLDAMLAYPVSSATASAYLTGGAADEWAAGDGVRIYRSPVVRIVDVGEDVARAEVDVEQSGTLDRTGHFVESSGPVTLPLDLVREGGEWRIDNPPPGLAITRGYFETYFRAFDVYHFDVDGDRLVADPVHLQVGDRLATSLTAALVAGADPRVAGETRTYVPDAADWNPAVTVVGGRATVEFDTALTTLDVEVRRRLSAQIVRTLAQVPAVEVVRIVGSDGALVAGGRADQPVTAWARFDPQVPVGRPGAVVEGRLASLEAGAVDPVSGVPDDVAATADLVAVRSGGWAAVDPGGAVRIVDEAGQREDRVVDPVALSWSADGRLWVVDRPGGRLHVRILSSAAPPVEVQVPGELAGITSFALDASGGRYAVTRDSGQVLVGVVDDADGTLTLGPPVAVAPDVVAPADVTWIGPSRLAVVGDGETGRQVYRARIDGSPSDASAGSAPRLPNLTITALAAGTGPDPDLYVTDGRARLWYLPPGGSWRLLGVEARGLTSGR